MYHIEEEIIYVGKNIKMHCPVFKFPGKNISQIS